MLTARKVVPSGLPRCRSVSACSVLSDSDVLSRNSWVMAIPIEAKANEVRSQARNVRSEDRSCGQLSLPCLHRRRGNPPSAKWSRATLPLFSSSMLLK